MNIRRTPMRPPSPPAGQGARRLPGILLSLFLFTAFLPAASFASVVVDTVRIGQSTTTTSTLSWTHNTLNVQNRIMIVCVALRGNSTVAGITYGNAPTTQTLSFLGGQNNDANPQVRIEMWYLITPQAGNFPVNVTLSSNSNAVGTSVSLTGVNIASPADAFQFIGPSAFQSAASTGSGGSIAPSVAVTSNAGDVILSSVATEGNAGGAASGQSLFWPLRVSGTTAPHAGQAGSYAPGAANVTMDWTLQTATKWAVGAVSVRPAVTISGVVFEDADFAGTASEYDGGLGAAGDVGLPNVDVELYNGATNVFLATTTTAADGSYSFPGLPNGPYKVRVRSATIGDADTPPRGGRIGAGTWPDPLPELAWANGTARYGGESPVVDDTATPDNAGPGDTNTALTLAGSDAANVNFGFAYNLIVNVTDDIPPRGNSIRSTQGSLRQFIKNANAIGQANGTTASSSQFRMQVPTNQTSGGDAWWRIAPLSGLPDLQDAGTTLDGSTQQTNNNTRGPEIEINGSSAGSAIGLHLTGNAVTLRGVVINRFPLSGIVIDGSNAVLEGNYVGTDATGSQDLGNPDDGVKINGNNNIIGGALQTQRNVISGNNDEGIDINPGATGNVVIGNYIGTNAAGDAAIANGLGGSSGGVVVGGTGNRVGGSAAGEGNVISGNTLYGLRFNMGASGNSAFGNYIGTNAAGVVTVGNTSAGVMIDGDSRNNTVGGTAPGEANIIAYNGGAGVFITGSGSDNNVVSGNSIYENGGLGIDLAPNGPGTGGGANNNKARPTLTAATASGADYIVTATVTSGDTIEFYRANNPSSPSVTPDAAGEGYLYLGSCVDNSLAGCSGPHIDPVPDANGAAGTVQATLRATGVASGDTISATATRANDGTSEFSANRVLPLAIVKQAWLENGAAPLPSPLTAPVGSAIVFLIYVKNTTAGVAADVRITDLLDEVAFRYDSGSIVRTSAAAPPPDTAADLAIFAATAAGTGTALTDGAGDDTASAADTDTSGFVDRITVGAATNASLSIAAHSTFAIRFRVLVR